MEEDIKKILELLRPSLHADGGEVELEDVRKDGTVIITLTGFCSCCHATTWTHRVRIERALKEKYPEVKVIVRIGVATCKAS